MEINRRLARNIAPFGAAALLAFALVPIGNRVEWVTYALAAALTIGIGGASVLIPWGKLPRALRIVPSLLFLVAVAMLRDASGGVAAGVGALALVPVFWLALYGNRAELLAMIVAVCAFFLTPALLTAGPEYPIGIWRIAVVFAAASAIIGFAVQDLVARVRSHAEALAVRERDLEAIADLSRSLSGSSDFRERICAALCELCGADFAVLLEGAGDGALARTAGAGPDLEASKKPATVLFERIYRGDHVIGMLVAGWREPPSDTRRAAGLVRLLAADAASVLERAQLLGQLTEIALTDGLTGLPNRRAWDTRFEQAIGAAEPVCVAILDFDLFKSYNDEHGHQAGDRLLKEAAAAWRAVLRPTDTLARYGGEEFAVLLHGLDLRAAQAVVERLRAATPRGQSCSAGVARRDAGDTVAGLLERADRALYEAKRAGRDRSQVADSGANRTA